MEGGKSPKASVLELARYFGFAIISVVVLIVAFLFTSKNISEGIHTVTYQALKDSTRQECASIQKYIDLLVARTSLIAEHEAEKGPKTLVETLRVELEDNVTDAEIGFANPYGYLIYSDQPKINVAGEDWFAQSIKGEAQVFLFSRNATQEQRDLLIATPVDTAAGTSGVLFVTIDGTAISGQINTQAYDGKAMSVICDSSGTVLFCEPKLNGDYIGKSVFDYADSIKMYVNAEAIGLAAALKRGVTTSFTYSYYDNQYYAVTAPVGVQDWRIIAFVSSDVADAVQRQVNLYLIGMLIVMLAVGILMAVQAYLHEQVTVRKLEQDKELLRQGAQRYKIITRLSNEVLFHVDLQSGEISFNDNFEGMLGYAPPACSVDRMEKCLSLFVEQDHQRFISMMNRLRAGAAESHEELRMIHLRGAVRWKRIDIFSVFDQSGQAVELVGKIVDVHRQKQSMQRLIRQADSEPLTGLLNRGAMERSVKAFLSGEGLRGKHALMMMDFDNFKAVNDTLGHAKGDDLLVSFAAVIRRVFRASDLSSRIGGDEYMVFMKNVAENSTAQEKAEGLREEMKELSRKIGVSVSVSVGIAMYNLDGETFERLYKAADKALYHVKNSGKNRVVFYSSLSEAEKQAD